MSEAVKKEKRQAKPVSEKFLFRLSLADVLRLTMFGTLIAVSNDILRMPLHLPGHTSIWWMGILVLGRGLIPRFGAGTIMGAVSGMLAGVLGLGSEGAFVFFKYFVPGLLLDFIAPVFMNRLENPFVGIICGALASLAKLAMNLALGVLLQLPMGFLALGLGGTSLTHTVFGAMGGFVAAILIKRLKPRLANWY